MQVPGKQFIYRLLAWFLRIQNLKSSSCKNSCSRL